MSTGLTSDTLHFDDPLEAMEYYFEQGWTDGLPVVPPTPERVAAALEAAGLEPSRILGTEPTKGRVITAEKAAVNAVMAGCKPEYFPVVAAAVEAMCEPRFNLHAITASTMGAAILVVVNGPIARRLGVNSGTGALGSGHRANATIGRALRLTAINATGARPGEIDKATLGHPGKYSYCLAEAEEVSPWEPLHVERGMGSEDSAVTLFAGLAPLQVAFHESTRPEDLLTALADAMLAVGPGQQEVVVVLSPEHVGYLRAAGWSKEQVKTYLWERARRPASHWVEARRLPAEAARHSEEKVGVVRNPEGVTLLVAGGAAGGFSDIIPLWGGGAGSRSVTRPVITS